MAAYADCLVIMAENKVSLETTKKKSAGKWKEIWVKNKRGFDEIHGRNWE